MRHFNAANYKMHDQDQAETKLSEIKFEDLVVFLLRNFMMKERQMETRDGMRTGGGNLIKR